MALQVLCVVHPASRMMRITKQGRKCVLLHPPNPSSGSFWPRTCVLEGCQSQV